VTENEKSSSITNEGKYSRHPTELRDYIDRRAAAAAAVVVCRKLQTPLP